MCVASHLDRGDFRPGCGFSKMSWLNESKTQYLSPYTRFHGLIQIRDFVYLDAMFTEHLL